RRSSDLDCRYVTIGHEYSVAGMVVSLVEGLQFFVAEIGNVLRFAATVVMVGGGGEQVATEGMPEYRVRGTHGAFHLIEDHTLELQVAGGVVRLGKLQPMALLGEVQLVQAREEHGVQVDLEQVVEVLPVLAGEGVGGPVAAGEGVHEGVQGPA